MKKLMKTQSARFVAVLIAAVLVALIAAGSSKLAFLRVDVTAQKVMTMDEKAVEVVKALDEDVEIYYLATETGKELWVDELVQKYDRMSGHVSYQMIDPAGNQAARLAADAGTTASENALIVRAGDRTIAIAAENLYNVVYNDMYYYYYGELVAEQQSFVADQELVNAILYVTRDDLPVIYALNGHGETAVSGLMLSQIQGSSIVVKNLSLTGVVPEDAAAVLIHAPTADLSEGEREALMSYLKQGGSLILTTGYMMTDMPNLEKVLTYYGMKPVQGVVLEMTSGYCYSAEYPQYITPDVSDHPLVSAMSEAGIKPLMPLCGAIERSDVERNGLTVSELMTTSDTAYMKTNLSVATIAQEEGDPTGKYTLAMAAEEGDTHIAWYMSGSFLSDNDISVSGGYNLYLLSGALKWMTTVADRVVIEDGNLLSSGLTALDGGKMLLIYAALFVPALAVLVIGVLRKGKKS